MGNMYTVNPASHNVVSLIGPGEPLALIVFKDNEVKSVPLPRTLYLRHNDTEVTVRAFDSRNTVTLDYRKGEHIIGAVYENVWGIPFTLSTLSENFANLYPGVAAMHKRAVIAS